MYHSSTLEPRGRYDNEYSGRRGGLTVLLFAAQPDLPCCLLFSFVVRCITGSVLLAVLLLFAVHPDDDIKYKCPQLVLPSADAH
jgi:hypothetical protein